MTYTLMERREGSEAQSGEKGRYPIKQGAAKIMAEAKSPHCESTGSPEA